MSETITCSVRIKGKKERQTKAIQRVQTRFSLICVLQPTFLFFFLFEADTIAAVWISC